MLKYIKSVYSSIENVWTCRLKETLVINNNFSDPKLLKFPTIKCFSERFSVFVSRNELADDLFVVFVAGKPSVDIEPVVNGLLSIVDFILLLHRFQIRLPLMNKIKILPMITSHIKTRYQLSLFQIIFNKCSFSSRYCQCFFLNFVVMRIQCKHFRFLKINFKEKLQERPYKSTKI